MEGQPNTVQAPGEKRSVKDSVAKFFDDIKADIQKKKANIHNKHNANKTEKLQNEGQMPEYSMYGIGAQPTDDQLEQNVHTQRQQEEIVHGTSQLVYPAVVNIESIRVPLDTSGQPDIRNIAIQYSPATKVYSAQIVDAPLACPAPGAHSHNLASLVRYVQFSMKDTMGRDITVYSNRYCRSCGYHELVTRI